MVASQVDLAWKRDSVFAERQKDAESCGTKGIPVHVVSMWAKEGFFVAKETFHRCSYVCNETQQG